MSESNINAEALVNKTLVLLVEDNPTILEVHKKFLEKMGLLVDTAITGEEALTKFQNYHYPLVILDGGLPDMTGKDLGLLIREHEQGMNRLRTPLILLTGFTEEDAKKWCKLADIDDYAIKPVHPLVLEKIILSHITSF